MNTGKEQEQQETSTQAPNPHNPFRDDAPQAAPSPAEEAELEQQRKEALTERD